MTRIYRYVLMHDRGMAPHPGKDGIVSLATCKPRIRETARAGDWILGNYPSPNNDVVAWAGIVDEVIPVGLYGVQHVQRRDALYPNGPDGQPIRHPTRLQWYHREPKNQAKDMRGNALLFDPASTWYFGENGRALPPELVHLAARGIGHRVNGTLPGDADRLRAWLTEQAPPGVHGLPRDGWDGPSGRGCGPAREKSDKQPKSC